MGLAPNNRKANMAYVHAVAYGRVQGVFFRSFVQNIARQLGLKGYVRNLARGDAVEVSAEGERGQLDKLLAQLRVGPPGARVDRLEVKWGDYSGQFDDFSITY